MKKPGLWEATSRTSFEAPFTDGVLNPLLEADRLASGRLVLGPLVVEGNVTVFDAFF